MHRFPAPAAAAIALAIFASFPVPPASATDEGADFPGEVRLLLPPVVYALAGMETNIYFDNAFLALNPANYAVDVTCQRGTQQNERWTWTLAAKPDARDLGDHSLRIELRDAANRVVARASTVVKARARTAPGSIKSAKPLTLLIIGDSLTNASAYSRHVLDLAKADGLPLRLIGTRGDAASGNRHEGYGGWTAARFATHYTGRARGAPVKECGSPFLYKADPKDDTEQPRLDFARYCKQFGGGAAPDFVTILLGCNDTFHGTDEDIDQRIDTMFGHYETLVKMIHGLNPATRVGAILPMPPAATQDAFGANYGSGQTRWQYRRNQHRAVERMLETFGGREADNLFLLPAWLNLDTVHGFPTRKTPINAHVETKITRLANGVHPSKIGYRQLGDSLYAWLRSFDAVKP